MCFAKPYEVFVPISIPSLSFMYLVFASKPYCVRCASSAITTILLRLLSSGNFSSLSSGKNFCTVVKTIPPPATFNFFIKSSLSDACVGSWCNNWRQFAKVSKSWSSKSFLSVITKTVGLFNCNTNLPV